MRVRFLSMVSACSSSSNSCSSTSLFFHLIMPPHHNNTARLQAAMDDNSGSGQVPSRKRPAAALKRCLETEGKGGGREGGHGRKFPAAWCYVIAAARGKGCLLLFLSGHTSHETDDPPRTYINACTKRLASSSSPPLLPPSAKVRSFFPSSLWHPSRLPSPPSHLLTHQSDHLFTGKDKADTGTASTSSTGKRRMLDTTRQGVRVWLVKVPVAVAEAIKNAQEGDKIGILTVSRSNGTGGSGGGGEELVSENVTGRVAWMGWEGGRKGRGGEELRVRAL